MPHRRERHLVADVAGDTGISMMLLIAAMLCCSVIMDALLKLVFPSGIFPQWVNPFISAVCAVVSFGGAAVFLARRQGFKAGQAAQQKPEVPAWIVFCVFIGCVVAANGLTTVAQNLMQQQTGSQIMPQTSIMPKTTAAKVMFFISVCVVSPVMEELFFRGIMQRALKPFGIRMAVLVPSLFFTLMHGSLAQLPALLLLSLLLGWAAEVTGSLKFCMLLHGISNVYVFLLLLVVPGQPSPGQFAFVFLSISVVVGLFGYALRTVKVRRLWPQMKLPPEAKAKPGRKSYPRLVAETPPFMAGMLSALAYFTLRILGVL